MFRNLMHRKSCKTCNNWEDAVLEFHAMTLAKELTKQNQILVLQSLCSKEMEDHLPDRLQDELEDLRKVLIRLLSPRRKH